MVSTIYAYACNYLYAYKVRVWKNLESSKFIDQKEFIICKILRVLPLALFSLENF